jgi:hypothetical protein
VAFWNPASAEDRPASERNTTAAPLAWRAALILAVLAFALRAAWYLLIPLPDWPDTWVYLESGKSLLESGVAASKRVMPGYPLLIALAGYHGVIWVQIALSAATVGLIVLLAQTLWQSRLAGIVSGIIAAGYPVLIFYANMRLTETTTVFLLLAAFLACYRGHFLVGSGLLVLSILVRPTIDFIAPLLVVLFCVARGEVGRIIASRLLLYGAVYVAMMTPWWLHNYAQYGTFVRLNLGDGIFMLLENNPLYDKVGLHFGDLAPVFEKFRDVESPVELNEARKVAAWAHIVENPTNWLTHSLDRLRRFWSPTRGYIDTAAAATAVPVMLAAALAIWRFGSVAFLVRFGPILLLIVYLTLVHSAFHALPRYRMPLEGFLIVLAGGWLSLQLSHAWMWGRELAVRAGRKLEPAVSANSTPRPGAAPSSPRRAPRPAAARD